MKSIKEYISENEILSGGTSACAGCGALIGLRYVLYVLGENTIVCNPACCMTLINYAPHSCMNCSWIHTAFECMGSTASGIRHSLNAKGENMNVVVYAGDGGTYDIGMQSLSFAAVNNENIIYICYNNSGYGNTGFQWSTATSYGADTKTQPRGSETPIANAKEPKDMAKIVAAHGDHCYVATANIAFPIDYMNKVEKAKNYDGFSYIEVLIPCCTGWGFDSSQTITIGKAADKCGAWPLYEIENGILTLNKKYNKLESVDNYLNMQNRYKALPEMGRVVLQNLIEDKIDELKKKNGKKYV